VGGRLRIAFLDSWWRAPARGSGTAVGIAGLAGGLSALGHRVTVADPRRGTPGRMATRLLYNLELASRVRPGAFDLVVGFDWDGWGYPSPPGVPYVVCLKGVVADEARFERGWPRAQLKLQAVLEAWNARRAARVVTTSRYSKTRACSAYGLAPAAVAVVPEGIDLAAWPRAPRRPAGPPTILSVARQYPRKNTRSLLEAMPRVRRAVPDARLRVVGAGPELPALQRLARRLGLESCVRFLGAVPDGRVRAEFARAHVFCLPSLQEGFGIVYLEAMAAGLPVVAGDRTAAAEVVAPRETGLLVPPRDPEALAGALVRLLEDPALRARMGAAGRTRAEAHAWPAVARRFLRAVGA